MHHEAARPAAAASLLLTRGTLKPPCIVAERWAPAERRLSLRAAYISSHRGLGTVGGCVLAECLHASCCPDLDAARCLSGS